MEKDVEWIRSLVNWDYTDYLDAFHTQHSLTASKLVHASTNWYADTVRQQCDYNVSLYNQLQEERSDTLKIHLYDFASKHYPHFMLFRSNTKLYVKIHTGLIELHLETVDQKLASQTRLLLKLTAVLAPFNQVQWLDKQKIHVDPTQCVKMAFNSLVASSLPALKKEKFNFRSLQMG